MTIHLNQSPKLNNSKLMLSKCLTPKVKVEDQAQDQTIIPDTANTAEARTRFRLKLTFIVV